MKNMTRWLAVLAVSLAAFSAAAQTYPTKPVKIVVGFAPGGGSDFAARVVAQQLTERLKSQVIVENKPGAGSLLGAEYVIKSAPDGYTLLLTPASYTVNPSVYKLTFDPLGDITPIAQISKGPYIVAVHPSVPAKTLKELVDYAKANPGKLSYASSGNGAHIHVATEYFLYTAGINIVHVPYKGTGPALNDTVGGQVQMIFGSVATALQYVKSGRLRPLAVTTPKRIAAAPDVPTVAESGYPGWEVTNWHGLVGPKGLPKDIVQRLNKEINVAVHSEELKKVLSSDGLEPAGGTPEELSALLKSEVARWAQVVKRANIKID
ncbi:MAG TPA: tripartite tricarboxylate transporter substrate binding protein [Burkholderiales bacterium]|nr:tripartite tricarboxylate transporter substrate binding protein [Burkholderiales bacterium]